MTQDYHVRLEAFEGPLDLLLYLIRSAEVEITDIPIATIADQYLEYLHHIDTIDIERAGEFLVMAATLMEIKSRLLVPRPEDAESSQRAGDDAGAPKTDPRAELVHQLLEYKRYRDAAERLERQRIEWLSRFPAAPAHADAERLGEEMERLVEVDLEDLELLDLVRAFARILDTVDFDRLDQHRVVMDETPLELHAEDLLDRLRRETAPPDQTGPDGARAGLELAEIFKGRTRGEMIGLFLAMLELIRQRKVIVTQEQTHARPDTPGDPRILVQLAPPEPPSEEQSPPEGSNAEAAEGIGGTQGDPK